MPKYHLVSDLLNDLMIEDRGDFYRFGCLRKMIEDEWVEGTIKMLRVSPESAEPVVWEPAQRQLTTTMVSGERWIKCRISQGIKVLFEDPSISDEDVQYVKGRAVEAGLVLAELWSDVIPDSPYGLAASQYLSKIHISFQEFAKFGAEKYNRIADESR